MNKLPDSFKVKRVEDGKTFTVKRNRGIYDEFSYRSDDESYPAQFIHEDRLKGLLQDDKIEIYVETTPSNL